MNYLHWANGLDVSTERDETALAGGYLEFYKWPWSFLETWVARVFNNIINTIIISFLWVYDSDDKGVKNTGIALDMNSGKLFPNPTWINFTSGTQIFGEWMNKT